MKRLLCFLAALPAVLACPSGNGAWTDDPPRGSGDTPRCSVDAPTGDCDSGQTCRAGQCVDDAILCSSDNEDGVCANTDETCVDGACLANDALCAVDKPDGICASGLSCHNGVCATDAACAPAEPLGFCDAGLACIDGTCVNLALLCDDDTPTGLCAGDKSCVDGDCFDDVLLCAPNAPLGLCPSGETCLNGGCRAEAELCSDDNPTGACDAGLVCIDGACVDADSACGCVDGQTCVDGVCRNAEQLCSAEQPAGVCAQGAVCVAGVCTDLGAACSPQNLTGVCAPGALCDDGVCVSLDGAQLCDDNNPCTSDSFDTIRNRCSNLPVQAMCDDGNACTTDVCSDGVCEGSPIGGCVEPPLLEPVVSPTNVGTLILRGTKPAGAGVEINGLSAVAESPDTTWQVTLNLTPGTNNYDIRSADQGTFSAIRHVSVVYDVTAPSVRVTPEGGVLVSGVTATIAADEPATVFVTTDGSVPDTHSPSFASLRQMRVYADMTLSAVARDVAGNLGEVTTVRFEVTGRATRISNGPNLADAVSLSAAAVLGNTIVVAGGTDGLAPQAGVVGIDKDTHALTTLPSMSGARDALVLVTVGSATFAIGGENAGTPLNRVERLVANGATWEARAPMPSTRHSLAAVAFGGQIFAFGGKSNGGAVLSNVEVYNIGTDSWSNSVAQMPRPRAGHGAVVVEDRIYLVGGENSQGTPVGEVDVYVPATNTWTTVAPLPTPRHHLGVTLVANRGNITSGSFGIIAAGGIAAGGGGSALVELYDVDSDRWTTAATLPQPRHSMAAVHVEQTSAQASAMDTVELSTLVIGGQQGADLVDTTLQLVTPRDYSRRLPDLPEGRFGAAAAALDDKIYVMGGRDFSEEAVGFAFDPETGTYEALPPLLSLQNGAGAATVDDRVYLIGGADGFGNAVPTCRAFDRATMAWVELAPMISARRDVAVTVLGQDIYVIGGDNGGALPTVEIYNTVDNDWRQGPLLPQGRRGAMAATLHGVVYVLGGESTAAAPVTSFLQLTNSAWVSAGGAVNAAYGAAFALHDRIAVVTGRIDGVVDGMIVDVIPGETVFTLRRVHAITIADRRAAVLHQGHVYLFGGNENATPGPSGIARVEELRASCLNGVQDLGETGVDSAAGCVEAGSLHHTGLGLTFENEFPIDLTSPARALDACVAHHGSANACRFAPCGGNQPLIGTTCECNSNPVWYYGTSTHFGSGAAGTVMRNCSPVGFWD